VALLLRWIAAGMRRIKRFVLAENSEKDPTWTNSDSLRSGLARSNSHEEEAAKSEPSMRRDTSGHTAHHHGMT
jgi:hypothetical protein